MNRIVAFACAVALAVPAIAEEKVPAKEVTLTGTLVCGHCKLGIGDGCSNVLQVKEGEKVVNFWLLDKGKPEAYHVCGGDEKAGVKVTGVVSEKDGKKWVKASKVELPKK